MVATVVAKLPFAYSIYYPGLLRLTFDLFEIKIVVNAGAGFIYR